VEIYLSKETLILSIVVRLGLKCLSFRELIHSNKGLDTVNSGRENLRTSFSSSTQRM